MAFARGTTLTNKPPLSVYVKYSPIFVFLQNIFRILYQRAMATHRKNSMPRALLLGMVYSEEEEPKRGQEFRDRVRCEAMEELGYSVFTLDNKHDDTPLKSGKHCTANFADARRMFMSMKSRWEHMMAGSVQFDHIILDYFFSPVGWARERWTENLFRDTLPQFATDGILKETGSLWLPNLKCVEELILAYSDELHTHYTWELIKDPTKNPLYLATEAIEDELLKCPDSLTNETQIRPLDDFSETPFYEFKRKVRKIPTTPRSTHSNGSLTDRETDVESSPEPATKRRRQKR